MEGYKKDKAIAHARAMLSLLSVNDRDLEEFDGLCRDFDLTVADVTDWEEDKFYNPQVVEKD